MIHRLAARELINDLEQGCSLLHLPRVRCAAVLSVCLQGLLPLVGIVLGLLLDDKQAEQWAPDETAIEAEITRLGVTYSLVSKHTSFLAIEPRTNIEQARPPPPPQPKQVCSIFTLLREPEETEERMNDRKKKEESREWRE